MLSTEVRRNFKGTHNFMKKQAINIKKLKSFIRSKKRSIEIRMERRFSEIEQLGTLNCCLKLSRAA